MSLNVPRRETRRSARVRQEAASAAEQKKRSERAGAVSEESSSVLSMRLNPLCFPPELLLLKLSAVLVAVLVALGIEGSIYSSEAPLKFAYPMGLPSSSRPPAAAAAERVGGTSSSKMQLSHKKHRRASHTLRLRSLA
jgi:hypothetical protein